MPVRAQLLTIADFDEELKNPIVWARSTSSFRNLATERTPTRFGRPVSAPGSWLIVCLGGSPGLCRSAKQLHRRVHVALRL